MPRSTPCSVRRRRAGAAASGPHRTPTWPSAAGSGPGARPQLLPVLHAVNDRVGWISPGALNYVAQRLEVAPAEAYGVLTFYALFSPIARPPRVVHVCVDLACRTQGSAALTSALGPEGEAHRGGAAAWHPSPCLGLCERAPAAMVVEAGAEPRVEVVAPATVADVEALLRGDRAADEPAAAVSVPQQGDPGLVLLRRIGGVDPASLDDYRAHGGYGALRRALDLGPAGVIREVTDAKLAGRGGAAFPTGRKWDAVAAPARPPAPPGLQRRRERAGHVQGPGAHGGRPVRGRRGDDDRRASPPAASTATCTCGASTRAPVSGSSTPSPRPAGTASWATT